MAIVCVLIVMAAPANAAIKITKIDFDPPGADISSDPRVAGEYIRFKNTGTTTKSMAGWRVFDLGREHRYVFSARIEVGPGSTVTLYTGRGENLSSMDGSYMLFWDLDHQVWNNDGDKATLKTKAGKVADRCAYTASTDSPRPC